MGIVQKTQIVNGSIDRVWEEISRLDAIEDWHPNVKRAEVLTEHHSGVGAARRIEMYRGGGTVETVVDEVEHRYTTVEMTEASMMKSAFVTISTEERSADATAVTFSIDYRLKYGPLGWLMDAVMMKRMFPKVFGAALDGLSYHLETGNVVVDSIPEQMPG